jgi:hypothetical protein
MIFSRISAGIYLAVTRATTSAATGIAATTLAVAVFAVL